MKFSKESLIKQKEYSKEQYAAKKKKTFGVAKRVMVMSQLMVAFGYNCFVALGLFILLCVGTSALPYFFNVNIEFTGATFMLQGGLFASLLIVFMILFTIAGFWYAIGFKKLEIMCIHLDGSLEGARAVSASASRSNRNQYKAIAGALGVTGKYLKHNNIKIGYTWFLLRINRILIACQIIVACVCVFLSLT